MIGTTSSITRCPWTGIADAEYARYHDEEWGVPLTDSRLLFEKLILEGFQSRLSWLTILKKRDNFRRAFDHFDADKIANYGQRDIARLMGDAGIVRNKLKILSAIDNAEPIRPFREIFPSRLSSGGWRKSASPPQNANRLPTCRPRPSNPYRSQND